MKTNRMLPSTPATLVSCAILALASSGWAAPTAANAPAAPLPRPQSGPVPMSSPPRKPAPERPFEFDLPAEFRSIDGANNNHTHPEWGTPNLPFRRLVPADFADGASAPSDANRPSARAISNAVAKQSASRPNARGASDMLWQWGQFLDHDLDETPTAVPEEPLPIKVPTGDPEFDPTGSGVVVIPLNRSAHTLVNGIRQQINGLTAWIDGSQVYGVDAARAAALRTLDGTGKLKTTSSAFGDLLPMNPGDLPNIPPGPGFYIAGDIRVNEQTGLIAIHTLFLREHNHWATLYKSQNLEAGDEEIYQFARMIVAAEIQAITYREYLPLIIGPNKLPPYSGYKPTVEPTISNEFATAAYRFGHSLLSPKLLRLDARGQEIPEGHLSLANSFFRPDQIQEAGIDPVLRGLVTQRCQELDEMLIDDVRNFLFGSPGSGGFDLASLNIQRGRDHGLPGLSATRSALGLPPLRDFHSITREVKVVNKLKSIYANPVDVDLWIGGLAESDVPGAMVGPTFHRILVDQFVRLRDGDRFWYQSALPKELREMVDRQSLATIIRRNTTVRKEIPDQAFLAPPPRR